MKTLMLTTISIFLSIFSFGQMEERIAVDSIFSEWDKSDVPGGAVGIYKDGKILYARGYGLANLEHDIPNAVNSVFRIASTSKQFTAASIILLAEEGKIDLDDKLSSFFPEFPDYGDEITVRHLMNHTSGIRDYLILSSLKGLRMDDYFEDRDVMNWLVDQDELNFSPGDEYLYSNSGYWLLGQIVNQVSGMDMADFAKERIFDPLEMANTHFHNDHTQVVKNRASGYVPDEDGNFKIGMTTLNMIGDGGIFSTIEDMKKWDDAYYNSEVFSDDFWSMMTTQGILNDGEVLEYASGLIISEYKGLKTVGHSGSFVGFRSNVVRFPEHRFTVAIFANRGDVNPIEMAYRVADIFLNDYYIKTEEDLVKTGKQENPITEINFSLEQMSGIYELEPGIRIKVWIENDSLKVTQSWDEKSFSILRGNGNTFHAEDSNVNYFSFSRLKEGVADVLTINRYGEEHAFKRKEEVDLSGINLEEYTGNYYSKELDAVYNIFLENESLKLKIGRNEPSNLFVEEIDQLSLFRRLIRFRRESGRVTGFDLDAGRIKNLKFEKE